MSITAVNISHRGGTGGSVSGKGPLAVCFHALAVSDHTYSGAEGLAARWGLRYKTDLTYTDSTKSLGKTASDYFKHFAFARQSLVNATYRWVSTGVGNEFACELAAGGDPGLVEPVGLEANTAYLPKSTVGSLGPSEWGWGDYSGFKTIVVDLGGTDPDGAGTDYVQIVHGDGTHIQLFKSGVTSADPGDWFPIDSKTSDDFIVLKTAIPGTSDYTGITAYVGIRPFHDLMYMWHFENARPFTNLDTRWGYGGAIPTDMHVAPNTGMVWDEDGTALCDVYDFVNGAEHAASVEVVVDVDTSAYAFTCYISNAGNDGNDGLTPGTAKRTWKAGVDQLYGTTPATGGRQLIVIGAYTDTMTSHATTWNSRVGPYSIKWDGTGGAKPLINGANLYDGYDVGGTDIRVENIRMTTGGAQKAWITRADQAMYWGCEATAYDYNFDLDGCDVLIGDCTFTNSFTYAIFGMGGTAGAGSPAADDTVEGGIKRRILIGNTIADPGTVTRVSYHKGGALYNSITCTGAATKGPCLRFAFDMDNQTAQYVYFGQNCIVNDGLHASAWQAITHTMQGTASLVNDERVDFNFFDNQGTVSAQCNAWDNGNLANAFMPDFSFHHNVMHNMTAACSLQKGHRADIIHNSMGSPGANGADKYFTSSQNSGAFPTVEVGFSRVRNVNNSCYFLNTASGRLFSHSNLYESVSGVLLDGNIYRYGGTFSRVASTNRSESTWQSLKAGSPYFTLEDNTEVTSDWYVNADSDWNPKAASALIDAGRPCGVGGNLDYFGRTIDIDQPDVGAVQYVEPPPVGTQPPNQLLLLGCGLS